MRLVLLLLIAGCNNLKVPEANAPGVDTTRRAIIPPFRSIQYIESFMRTNAGAISKSYALREQYEDECTKTMYPLISTKGFYEDLAFVLKATAFQGKQIYGNFVMDDGVYYAKVQCIITKKQLSDLVEGHAYNIKFKTHSLQEEISFTGSTGKVELPTINAYLVSFQDLNRSVD